MIAQVTEPDNKERNYRHWGQWCRERLKFLGVRRFTDVSSSLGCHVQTITNWLARELPPDNMHKGLDRRLARALKTDAFTLFSGFKNISPEEAPIISRKPRYDHDRTDGYIQRAPTSATA
jgi:hypothetical protein